MKRFDDSTKKLIKNVAALLTSAVVLIAATIAWFATGSSNSQTEVKGYSLNSLANVSYSRLHEPKGVLESLTTGTGSDPLLTFCADTSSDPNATPVTPPSFGSWSSWLAETWDVTSTGDGAWNITSFYPGEYDAFKVVTKSSSPKLIINSISLTDLAGRNTLTDAQKEIVYKNIYLCAAAIKTTTVTDEQTGVTTTSYAPFKDSNDPNTSKDCIVCGSFYDLFEKPNNWSVTGTQKITILDSMDSAAGEDITFVLFIGVPGSSVTIPAEQSGDDPTVDNLRSAHDMLRQIGAKLNFGPVYPFDISM